MQLLFRCILLDRYITPAALSPLSTLKMHKILTSLPDSLLVLAFLRCIYSFNTVYVYLNILCV